MLFAGRCTGPFLYRKDGKPGMEHWQQRQSLLLSKEEMERIHKTKIAVLGLGGVGGAAAEALARCGVGHLVLIDHDTVDETNLNRQLFATRQTIGIPKVKAAKERLLSINPSLQLTLLPEFYLPENREVLFSQEPDWILDAVDTVTAKIDLIQSAREREIPLVTCLGTGNRLDPSLLRTGSLSETAGCGCALARILRRELKKRGITEQPCVYSLEVPCKAVLPDENSGRHSPGSISFVPPAAGYLMASFAIRSLLGRV